MRRVVKSGARASAVVCTSVLALLILGQCRRQDVPLSARAPASLPGTRAAAEPPAAPPVAAAAAADPARPPASRGDWLDGNIYRFRLDAVRACPAAAADGAARVGVIVRVASKIDELLVAPRDFKLESDGVILESAVAAKALGACAPLLAPKSLRAGKTADGVVVFDLPPGFNPDRRPVKLTYQPTRWGGAHRVEAILPPSSG
jgi:hypothetical protein